MLEDKKYCEITDLVQERPHVVILGAGASLASFPHGDKNGQRLPLMNDLITTCGLKGTLENQKVNFDGRNFEELYSDLYELGESELLGEVENKIFSYFSSLEIPDSPTLYDLLVISLRPKDLIATFNWDPFLWQALSRNHKWIDTPDAVFLHGNVSIGYCKEHYKMGAIDTRCNICRKMYKRAPLLYPIKQKNYQGPFISAAWTKLERHLNSAYMITVFGYSAPDSDVEAMRQITDAYKAPGFRGLEQFEAIDIKEDDELLKSWSSLIVEHHYQTCKDFNSSWIANHPRRSCDSMWQQNMEIKFLTPNHYPATQDWNQIRKWYQPLIDAEKQDFRRQGTLDS